MANRCRNRALKHTVEISGHRTSISLEPEFWQALKEAAAFGNCTPDSIVEFVEHYHRDERFQSLSSAVRVYLFVAAKCAKTN
jgi:predicted DNA-binding ribbon-helix-helix protein